ncbi:MAG: hypothetical protein ABI995_11650 [Acidobacteriota bacterium]
MTRAWLLLACFVIPALAEDKSLPNQAGNSKVGLSATAITDRKEIQKLLGIDLGEGYIVVRMKTTPQTPDKLRMSIDDFTLINRKNGEKSGAMTPSSIAGTATMIVARPDVIGGGLGTRINGMGMPVPIDGTASTRPYPGGGGIGNAGGTDSGMAEATVPAQSRKVDPQMQALEAALQAKVFVDQESAKSVEGLLYFNLQGKLQPKNLGLVYAGPAGRLALDFQ